MGQRGIDAGGVTLTVRVFGGVGVDDPGGAVGIGGHRQQRLLALLVIRHGSVVSLDWLAEYLWDDAERPDACASRLRTYLSRLRQSLPESAHDWIETESGGYRFAAPSNAVEHLRFGRLRAEARDARDRGDPLRARELLDEALAMWRGDPFRELEDLDWARVDIERLHIDRLEALEERWEVQLALGRHTQITGELGSFVHDQPLRERAVRQYALALHRSGRTAEGLRIIDAFRHELVEQTGLDPSPAVGELEQRILGGDPSLAVEPGRPLRGYRLLEEIGAGTFAVVWRAAQPSVGRDVAIKQIRSELVSRPEFIRRFEVEARLVARIEHPFIVPLIDSWRDPDSAYLVMRWLGGGTLERRLDDGPLSLDETLALAGQIGAALSAAHRHGVVHRDVKSSNILLDEVGNAYLSDFGIALEAAQADDPEAALSRGSPVYAAPEQLRGESVGPEADVFSLGVVLYECLTGSTPFGSADTVGELVHRQLHEQFPDLRDAADGVSVTVSEAIRQATAKDPADRHPTVDSFIDALHADVARDESASPAAVGLLENPYLGLRAFDDGDADRFFGRDRLVDEIIGRLSGDGVRSRCVVVIGPSGSGKSSVVRAGVVPALRRGAVGGSADWFTTMMVPGVDAFESLEAALLRIAVNPPASLLDQLRDGKRGILRGVRRCLPDDAARVTLVIDQLEELFTSVHSADADRFLDALAVAIDDPASSLRVVATLRADFYDRPLQHPTFAPVVKESAVEVTPLAPDELVAAIGEPARHLGVGFEPGLVARIAAEAVGQPAPLPLLQYTLSELFDRRNGAVFTIDEYESVGGIGGALATRAESLFTEADARGRAAIRGVFGRLVNTTATIDTRRRVPISDFGDDEQMRDVLERFGRARLLAFDRDPASREPTVEVAHEALLGAWPRAAAWLEEDRDLRRDVESIGTAATQWARSGRQPGDLYRDRRLDAALDVVRSSPDWLRALDHEFVGASDAHAERERSTEQRRIRRLRRLVVGITATLAVALVAGGIALTQQRRADREARAAEGAAAEADRQREVAEQQATVAEQQAAAAEAATAEAQLAALLAGSAGAEDPDVATLLALEARHRSPGSTTDRALLDAIANGGANRRVAVLPRLQSTDCWAGSPLSVRRIDASGLREFGVSDGRLVVRDLSTGETEDVGPSPQRCITWFEDAESGRRWAGTILNGEAWVGSANLGGSPSAWTKVGLIGTDELLGAATSDPGELPPGGLLHREAVNDRLLYYHEVRGDGPWEVELVVVDERTLEPIGTAVRQFVVEALDLYGRPATRPPATAGSTTLGLFAIAGTSLDDDESGEALIVLDASSGREIMRKQRPAAVTALAFDPSAEAVIAGREDGAVDVIDLNSGVVTQQLVMSEPDEVIALGVRQDGVRVVVGRRSTELFDQRGATVGVPASIPVSRTAWVRPDGVIVSMPDADIETLLIVDPSGGALAEHGWNIDPSATVVFGPDRAGVVTPSGRAEIVELASGDRASVDLVLPDGERFDAAGILPEPGGLLAWDRGTSVARWRDGQPVEHLELWSRPGTVALAKTVDGTEAEITDGFVGAGAALVFLREKPQAAYRFDPTPGKLAMLSSVTSPPIATVAAAPAPGDGLHLVLDTGVVRTYDASGRRTGETATGLSQPTIATADPVSGLVAVGSRHGAAVVDPSTNSIQIVDDAGAIRGLGFARDGSVLVAIESDGTVRLWDVEAAESIGTVWPGTGTASPSPPWYDPSTDSVWVASSGTILEFSLDPERWAERACGLVSRELTPDEWDRLVPGEAPQRPACG